MATLTENLNTIQTNLNDVRTKLVTSLTDKGIVATTDETLEQLSDKVDTIKPQKTYTFVNGDTFGSKTDIFDDCDFSQMTKLDSLFFRSGAKFDQFPPSIKWENITSMVNAFSFCSSLPVNIYLDKTYNCTNFTNVFFNSYSYQTKSVYLNTDSATTLLGAFEFMYYTTSFTFSNLSKVTDLSSTFYNCSSLSSITLDLPACTSLYQAFEFDSKLSDVTLTNTDKVITFYQTFQGCTSLTNVSIDSFASAKDISYIFQNAVCTQPLVLDIPVCTSLMQALYQFKCPSVIFVNSNKVTNIHNLCYNNNIQKLTLDCTSAIDYFQSFFGAHLKYINITNLATVKTVTSIDFSKSVWGTGDTDEEKATNVQSIVDTLLTNSFDRASAGYSTCTIKLSTATKALLTTEQLAAITAKGYTIA